MFSNRLLNKYLVFSLWSYSLVSGKGKEQQRKEWEGKKKKPKIPGHDIIEIEAVAGTNVGEGA